MRIRAAVKEETRAALVREGARLFAGQGFGPTTIDQVTAAAGTAKGTFYNYFKTKEELAIAVMASVQAEFAPLMQAAADGSEPIRERLATLFTESIRWAQANPELTMIWSVERLQRGRTGGPSPFGQALVRAIEKGQERGEMRTDRPAVLMALELEGIYLVYFAMWYHTGRELDLSQAMAQAVNAYLGGNEHVGA